MLENLVFIPVPSTCKVSILTIRLPVEFVSEFIIEEPFLN